LRKLLAFLLVSVAACSGARRAEYVLGAAGPWTEGFGKMNRHGIELALAEINAKGGIQGTKLRIEFQDDSGEGSRAAVVAQQFVNNAAISAVIGHVTSGAMVSAAKVYSGNLAAVATTATDPALTGISRWAFRVISSDSANGIDLAKAAGKLGLHRVCILYANDSYGRGLIDAFRSAFKGELLSMDPISGNLKDAEPYIAYIKARKPDLVFVASTEAAGMVLLREAKKQNLAATFMGGDGWTGIVADPASEGALVGAPFSADDPRPAARDFVAAFRAKYNVDPDGNAALGYDATKLLASAIAAAGSARAAIRDWIAKLDERTAVAGATGPMRFRPDGDPVGKGITLTRVHAGRLLVEKLP
jgi:branched-chain amino acid transport system substrate-binding protein